MGTATQGGTEDGLRRLDVELAERAGVSRARAQASIAAGLVTIDGRPASKASQPVSRAARIDYEIPAQEPLSAAPEAMQLTIAYEDEDIIVIDKPRDMVVHPSAGHAGGTVVNGVLAHVGLLPGSVPFRPGVVHRIDKDTSGLLMMAKTEAAMARLSAAVRAHRIDRRYLAIVRGTPSVSEGCIDAPIGRHPKVRRKQWVVASGRAAVTHYRVRATRTAFSVLELRLETGRTHQIRVHLAYRGWPIVGDPLYDSRKGGQGQLLHAAALDFAHPISGAFFHLTAPPPNDMVEFWLARGGERAALAPPGPEGGDTP